MVASGLQFPEGPVALADGSVLVVETRAGNLVRISPDGHREPMAHVDGGPNGAARGPDGAIYICNNGGSPGFTTGVPSIQRVDLDSREVETIYTHCDGRPLVGPNDLVFDPNGGFWFSDFGAGVVHYAKADGSHIGVAWSGLVTPNGLGISPDGKTLYCALTRTRQVLRRRIAAPGVLEPSLGHDAMALARSGHVDRFGLLVGLGGAQELDSLAIDSEGAICVGTLIDSGISVVASDGETVELLTMPDKYFDPLVTNLCFGGVDLRTAFITLSWTGRVVSCQWPVPGLRLSFQEVAR
jgi:gluconolactonase